MSAISCQASVPYRVCKGRGAHKGSPVAPGHGALGRWIWHGLPFLCMGLGLSIPQAGSWEIGYSFDAPTSSTNGLTWDGRALWHTNDLNPVIYKINPIGGAVLGTVNTTIPDQGDLEFGGNFLWVVSENDHYLHKINPSSGKTIDSILIGLPRGNYRRDGTNSIQMEGCTWDGRNVWIDGGSNRIIRIDPVSRRQFMYVMPFSMGYLDGMCWAFDHLWIVTNNAVIYEIEPCSMGILDEFAAPANVSAGPEGFAFDGENLWFADNDLDKIYKIILKFRIATKRAAVERAAGNAGSLSKSSACNEGTELTTFEEVPVPLMWSAVSHGSRRIGKERALPLFWVSPWRDDGSAQWADAQGRLRILPSLKVSRPASAPLLSGESRLEALDPKEAH